LAWVLWTVVFIIAQVAFLQTFKIATKNTKSTGNLTVAVELISAFSVLLFIPFFPWLLPHGWLTWVLLLIYFALYAINDRLDATTRKNLDISVDTMLMQIYRIFFLFAGIMFLSRSFVFMKLLGAIIIVVANFFVLFEKGKFQFNKYVWLKVLSSIVFAAAFTLENYNSVEFNLAFFVFLSFFVPAFFLLCARQATPRGIVQEMQRKDGWVVLICGLCQMVMTFAILRAYQFREHFIEIAAISSVYVIINVFVAMILLRERSGLIRKTIAAAVIVASIVLIATSW